MSDGKLTVRNRGDLEHCQLSKKMHFAKKG